MAVAMTVLQHCYCEPGRSSYYEIVGHHPYAELVSSVITTTMICDALASR